MISTSRDSTPARNATPLGTVARLRHWAALPIILAGAFMSTLDFFINAPLGVVALLLTPRVLPAVRGESRGRLDILGAALVTLGLVAVVLPLIAGPGLGWPLWTWLSLASAAPLLLTFGLTQRRLTARGSAPLLDLTLFRARAFTVGLLTELVFHAGMASFFLVLALYLQQGLGLTALASGEIFTVLALGFFATSLYAPRLVER